MAIKKDTPAIKEHQGKQPLLEIGDMVKCKPDRYSDIKLGLVKKFYQSPVDGNFYYQVKIIGSQSSPLGFPENKLKKVTSLED